MDYLSTRSELYQQNHKRIEQDRKVIKEYLTKNFNFNFGCSRIEGTIPVGLVFKKNWTLTINKTLPEDFNRDALREGLNNLNTNWPVKINN